MALVTSVLGTPTKYGKGDTVLDIQFITGGTLKVDTHKFQKTRRGSMHNAINYRDIASIHGTHFNIG